MDEKERTSDVKDNEFMITDSESATGPQVQRELQGRHLEMIALGGTIGKWDWMGIWMLV